MSRRFWVGLVLPLISGNRNSAARPVEGRETDEPNVRVVVIARLQYFIFWQLCVCKSDHRHGTKNKKETEPDPLVTVLLLSFGLPAELVVLA